MNQLIIDLGIILTLLGVFIAAFGKNFFLLRWIFGDRSMFSQVAWGFGLAAAGVCAMLLGGFH